MARPGKIDRMPRELREELGRRRESGATLDELLEWLDKEGVKVGKTAIWKHVRTLENAAREIRRGRARAEALLEVGESSGRSFDNLANLNVEILQGLILGMLGEHLASAGPRLTARDLGRLAQALAKLASAARKNQEIARARQLSAAAKTARQAARTARSEGLSDEAVQRIRATVLGTGADPAGGL